MNEAIKIEGSDFLQLPVVDSAPPERADAARNRERILEVAARLFDELGADNVSMDHVAEAAGVGKGTLYRRFGDRCGLARAILNERERQFQEDLIRGVPPLGPGAPAAERLVAFAQRMLAMLDEHGDLILASETGAVGTRFRNSIYASYRAHLRPLLRDLNPSLDDEYMADLLLSSLGAELVNYWRSDTTIDQHRALVGFSQLVASLAVPPQ